MAAAGAAASFAGGGERAFGDLVQGQMTANTLNTQASIANTQAIEAEQSGEYNAMLSGKQAAAKMGAATAAFGSSGVSVGGGSAEAILASSAANAELDRLNILHQADIKATNYRQQADFDQYGANSAITGSYFAAQGDILGGASKGASALSSGSSS